MPVSEDFKKSHLDDRVLYATIYTPHRFETFDSPSPTEALILQIHEITKSLRKNQTVTQYRDKRVK